MQAIRDLPTKNLFRQCHRQICDIWGILMEKMRELIKKQQAFEYMKSQAKSAKQGFTNIYIKEIEKEILFIQKRRSRKRTYRIVGIVIAVLFLYLDILLFIDILGIAVLK